jgi:two-component system cell cycle response regulator DivK
MMNSILYVEDDPIDMQIVRRILTYNEFLMLGASNGETGLTLAHYEHPDVILMDMDLPDMDAFEMVSRIRADKATRRIPVIAMAEENTPHHPETYLQAGFDGYLAKSLTRDELINTIRQILPH